MISANGGLPAHRYTPQVTPRLPRGSEPASTPAGAGPEGGAAGSDPGRTDQDGEKDVLELCPRSFDVFLQVGFVVENPKPKQQVEQGLNMDRINKINGWFWNPV